ncbi:MAG TPA: hypothetical protein VLM38_05395 [Blastocatellia bacterium]|nr:hypothetical protein [Blastocatellia bacterium]
MKCQIPRFMPFIISLWMIALAGSGSHAQTEQTRQVSIVQDMAPVGLSVRQTLRYTWANLNDPDPQKRIFEPVRIRVRMLAADASIIAEGEAAAVDVGKFESFDFKRDLINLPGEAETGRLQVRLQVTVIGRTKYDDIVLKRGVDKTFDAAVEVVDESSGRTMVSFGGGMNEISLDDTSGTEHLNPKSFQIISAGEDYLIGIVPGEKLRVNVVNPLAPPTGDQDGRKFKMLFTPLILNAGGQVIASGDEVELNPGEFHSLDFDLAGQEQVREPGTGRLQVRIEVRQRFFHGISARVAQGKSLSSVELIEANTGKTAQYLSPRFFVFGTELPQFDSQR